jgi:hypothetical protein
MLETLLTLLKVDAPAPEILLEEDGDLCLDYMSGRLSISITPTGSVAWAGINKHGTDLAEFIEILKAKSAGV